MQENRRVKGLVMVPAFCVLHGLQKTSLNFRSRKTILPEL